MGSMYDLLGETFNTLNYIYMYNVLGLLIRFPFVHALLIFALHAVADSEHD
jgi:hypothetical protein